MRTDAATGKNPSGGFPRATIQPTARADARAMPSSPSTALPESNSTTPAPPAVMSKLRKASDRSGRASKASRLTQAPRATATEAVNRETVSFDRSPALTTGPRISLRVKTASTARPTPRTTAPAGQAASNIASAVAASASQGMRSVTSTGGIAGRATATCPATYASPTADAPTHPSPFPTVARPSPMSTATTTAGTINARMIIVNMKHPFKMADVR